MAETIHVHAVGSKVWVRSADDTWLKGKVAALHEATAEVSVKLEDGNEVKIKAELCPLQNSGRPVEVRGHMGSAHSSFFPSLC
jgi:hypothetical protein